MRRFGCWFGHAWRLEAILNTGISYLACRRCRVIKSGTVRVARDD